MPVPSLDADVTHVRGKGSFAAVGNVAVARSRASRRTLTRGLPQGRDEIVSDRLIGPMIVLR